MAVAWLTPVLLMLLAFATYWGSQGNEPLGDDARTVWDNPAVSGGDLGAVLLGRYDYVPDETPDAVRPVGTLVNRVRYLAFHEDRSGYVWTQVFLHATCGALLALLILATVGSPAAALLSGCLFVVHPVASASVLRVPGVAEQLALAFGLIHLGVLARILRAKHGSRKSIAVAAATLLLSIWSHESGFLLLPVGLMWIAAARPSLDRDRTWVGGRLALALVATGVVALSLRLASLAAVPDALRNAPAVHPDTGLEFVDRAVLGLAAVWTNLRLLIYPSKLFYTYDFFPRVTADAWSVVGGVILTILLVVSLALAWRRHLVGTLWAGFSFAALLAALGVVAPIGDFVNERCSYFLLPAVLGVASWLGVLLTRSWPKPVRLSGMFVVAVLIGALAIRTAARADDYINEDTLIRSAIENSETAEGHYDLGNLYLARGQYAEARKEYEAALEINPRLWMGWINLGAVFSREEDYSLAMRAYDRALQGAGELPEYRVPIAKAHFNRALLLMRQNRNEEAVVDLQQTIAVLPDHLRAHANLAFIYRNSEDYDEQSIYHFNRAIELEDSPEAKQRLEEAMDYIHERRERLDALDQIRANAGVSDPVQRAPSTPPPQP